MNSSSLGKGFLFTALAFSSWGILPLYWKLLVLIDPLHILSFRILFSLLLVVILLLAAKDTKWLVVFREPKKAGLLILTALVLCSNWGLYIWAVNEGHTLDASLGYFINPLVSIVLGLIFYRERLTPLQWAAVAIAFTGVMLLTVLSGTLPWISLSLALTFGVYGLLKKKSPLSALQSLGAETLASMPVSLFLLFFTFSGAGFFTPVFSGFQGIAYLKDIPLHTLLLLTLSGAVSAFPLYFFALGAKTLPLSMLGFSQFISPTLQFLMGLLVFKENFPPHHFAAFGLIWLAVILYIISLGIVPARDKP